MIRAPASTQKMLKISGRSMEPASLRPWRPDEAQKSQEGAVVLLFLGQGVALAILILLYFDLYSILPL